MSVLNVGQKVLTDTSIAGWEFHTHQPLTTRYDNNDEVRIPVQDDLCTLPCESHIFIEGSLEKADKTVPNTKFCNNGLAYLFSQIRYELNGVVVDAVSNPGITGNMKGYPSLTLMQCYKYQNAGWFPHETNTLVDSKGNFNACVPLKLLLGFAEDYQKIITNIRQELVLVRSNSDRNALVGEEATVSIKRLYWKLPHINPGLSEEVALTKYIGRNVDTQIAFRNWQIHVYPAVNRTKLHTWAVSTMTKTSSPRYVILGFQTAREGDIAKDASQFDHCNFQNIRIYLNNERYPYDNLNINFDDNKYATLYEMFARFQSSYYGKEDEPLLNVEKFLKVPLIVIDTSKQKEHLQPSSITLRIEFETSKNVPDKTSAYCLVLNDRLFTYNPLTKMVKQM